MNHSTTVPWLTKGRAKVLILYSFQIRSQELEKEGRLRPKDADFVEPHFITGNTHISQTGRGQTPQAHGLTATLLFKINTGIYL